MNPLNWLISLIPYIDIVWLDGGGGREDVGEGPLQDGEATWSRLQGRSTGIRNL